MLLYKKLQSRIFFLAELAEQKTAPHSLRVTGYRITKDRRRFPIPELGRFFSFERGVPPS